MWNRILIIISIIFGFFSFGYYKGRNQKNLKSNEKAYKNLAEMLEYERKINDLSRSELNDVLRK